MASSAADYQDDDDFDDYNPHPYGGGYDITATYGSPLSPSSSICYPISSPASVPVPVPVPTPPPAVSSPVPRSPPPVAEPYYWPEPYDYGEAQREPMYATPEVFRGWPYLAGAVGSTSCGRDYWRQCMRGLDYLFGHSDGYGERLIGVDCHGVPVYASRKGRSEEAVVVEVAPPTVGTVQSYDTWDEPAQNNQLSWYIDARETTHASGQPINDSYNRSCERSYGLHGALDEPTWFPKMSFPSTLINPSTIPKEVRQKEEFQYQDFCSYDAENKIMTQPIYCYNQHFCELPLNVQVEPPEPVCSQKLEYHENYSTYDDQRDIHVLETSTHSYEIQSYAQISDEPLEPFKPSWSQNLGYYQACTEGEVPEYDNHTLASDVYGDMGSLFVSPFYPQEVHDEQFHVDEHVSSQQNWHDLSNWNVPLEDPSQITKSVDDSSSLNGSFWPFGDYSTCTV